MTFSQTTPYKLQMTRSMNKVSQLLYMSIKEMTKANGTSIAHIPKRELRTVYNNNTVWVAARFEDLAQAGLISYISGQYEYIVTVK